MRQPAAIQAPLAGSSRTLWRHQKHIINTSHWNCHYHTLPNCRTTLLSHSLTLSHCHTITPSICHSLTLSRCHTATLLSLCLLRTHSLITLSLSHSVHCRIATLWNCHTVRALHYCIVTLTDRLTVLLYVEACVCFPNSLDWQKKNDHTAALLLYYHTVGLSDRHTVTVSDCHTLTLSHFDTITPPRCYTITQPDF